jgi:hypothetical protein
MVESLQDKICHCNQGLPKLVGQGLAEESFELEYTDEDAALSPNPLSYATSSVEDLVPLPTPAPASTLGASNKENCKQCVPKGFSDPSQLHPIGRLIPIDTGGKGSLIQRLHCGYIVIF